MQTKGYSSHIPELRPQICDGGAWNKARGEREEQIRVDKMESLTSRPYQ